LGSAFSLLFGNTVQVATGTTTYSYGTGNQYQVTYTNNAGVTVNVTLGATSWTSGSNSTLTASWTYLNNGQTPNGANSAYNSLSIGNQEAFTVTTTPAYASLSITINFPGVDTITASLLGGANVNAGILKFDPSTNTYTRIPVNYVFNPYSFSTTLPAPVGGNYLLAAVNEVVQASATIGAIASIFSPALANQTWKWSVAQQDDLQIQFNSSTQNSITVTPRSHPVYPTKNINLGIWFDIDLATESATLAANISFQYTAAQLSAAAKADGSSTPNPQSLILSYYNTTTSQWTAVPTSVNANAQVVSAFTTHFSEWGLDYEGSQVSAGWIAQAQLSLIALSMLVVFLF